MAVPKQHRSKSRQGQRRMHIHLQEVQFRSCPKCAKPVLPHRVCENCGTYKEKEVVDVLSKLTKKERKAKEREMAASQQEQQPAKETPLSPEELSKSS